MKLLEFRDQGVRERLWKGARQWRDSSKGHRIEQAPPVLRGRLAPIQDDTGGVRSLLESSFLVLIAVVCFYFLLGEVVDAMTYLSVVIILAYLLAGLRVFFRSLWQENPVVLIAPVTNRGMKRQVIREVLIVKVVILCAAALAGGFFLPHLPGWEGALRTVTASLGFAGLLSSLGCLFKWKWIIRAGSLLFFAYVLRAFHSGYAAALQHWFDQQTWLAFWERGVIGWQRCLVLLAAGAVSFGYWFRRGILTMPLDRHWQGGEDVGEDVVFDSESLEISQLREPIGLVERLVWRFLSPGERVIARTAGFCPGDCGKAWLLGVALLIGGAVVLFKGVDVFGRESSFLWFTFPVMVLFYYLWGVLTEIAPPKSLSLVEAVQIGPNSQGTAFQVFPISYDSLRSLFWKESLFRIPMAASIGVLAPKLVFDAILGRDLGISAGVFGVYLVLVFVGFLWLNFLYWRRALSCVLARRIGSFDFLRRGDLVCGLAIGPPLVSLYALPQGGLPWEGVVLSTGLALLLGWFGDRMARARLQHPASDFVKPVSAV